MAATDEIVVDLSNVKLREIPEKVLLECDDTCSLDISGNPDIERHDFLTKFLRLKKLALNRCALRWIPDKIRELTNLEELQLDDNDFSGGLPPVLWRLVRLKKLSLKGCGLKTLADNMENLENLEELQLSWNEFSAGLPPVIGKLVRLKKLYLSMCNLTALPENIGKLEQLEVLILGNSWQKIQSGANRYLQGLTPAIRQLSRLKLLDLTMCGLTTLPDAMENLQQLEELRLGLNNFERMFPYAILRLVRLKKLYLHNCQLTHLLAWDGLLQLEVLVLGNYRLCDRFRDNTFSLANQTMFRLSFFTIYGLRRLQALDLRKSHLKILPQGIEQCQLLEELQLDENNYSGGIPTEIAKLVQLKRLYLNNCQLTSLPENIANLEKLEELQLGCNNFRGCLPLVIGGLVRLKKLDVMKCEVTSLEGNVADLQQLEELKLDYNHFSDGLPTVIGRLVGLKKLYLNKCELSTLPESIGDLKTLEELQLDYSDFSGGLPTVIGKLLGLKVLYLNKCKLTNLAESIGNLKQLEELQLRWNNFYRGLPPAIGRLSQLTTLYLNNCKLTSLAEIIGNLKQLNILILSKNKLQDYPSCTLQLGSLRTLDLSNVTFRYSSEDSEDNDHGIDVKDDEYSDTSDDDNDVLEDSSNRNRRTNGFSRQNICGLCACCQTLCPDSAADVLDHNGSKVNLSKSKVKGNCIKQLPIELAHTGLEELKLDGNPIMEPPEAIWKQGIKAIRSFMKAKIPGVSLMHVDTLNMIGDTGAGKTSIAQSLVARSPKPTAEADRTHVLHQHAMKVNSDDGQSVNINDFGGHDIYHSVIPIFLPANGIVILAFNLNDERRQEQVKKWLMTAIAKSSEIRVIIVGTHADEMDELRMDIEMQMLTFLTECLESAANEIQAHMNQLNTRSDDAHDKLTKLHHVHANLQKVLADFVHSAIKDVRTRQKNLTGHQDHTCSNLENLCTLLQNIAEKNPMHVNGQNNFVRFVTLSCLVANNGLDKLRQLVVSLLRPTQALPIRWCQVTVELLKERDNCLYLTMKQVGDICRVHFTASDDSEAQKTILRYLTKTSQIIWLEDHMLLREYVFYSPKKIIDTCKKMLYHDSKMVCNMKQFYQNELEAYEKGILLVPLLKELLSRHVLHGSSDKEPAEPESQLSQSANVILQFMEQFNIMSHVTTESGFKEYIIPSNLAPAAPEKLEKVEREGAECLNRVIVRLSFIGSIIPMSLFEMSLSLILTVANKLPGYRGQPDAWRDGVMVLHDGVYFVAKRNVSVITLVAFSKPGSPSPWTVLHPVLKSLNENVRSSWNGAPPYCAVVCPSCARRTHNDIQVSKLGEIREDLTRLAATYSQGEIRPMCRQVCLTTVPQSLCYATVSAGSFTNDPTEIEQFFRNIDDKHHHASASESSFNAKKTEESGYNQSELPACEDLTELQRKWWKSAVLLKDRLERDEIIDTVDCLLSQELIPVSQSERIQEISSRRDCVTAFTSIIGRLGDKSIEACLVFFKSRKLLADLTQRIQDWSVQ